MAEVSSLVIVDQRRAHTLQTLRCPPNQWTHVDLMRMYALLILMQIVNGAAATSTMVTLASPLSQAAAMGHLGVKFESDLALDGVRQALLATEAFCREGCEDSAIKVMAAAMVNTKTEQVKARLDRTSQILREQGHEVLDLLDDIRPRRGVVHDIAEVLFGLYTTQELHSISTRQDAIVHDVSQTMATVNLLAQHDKEMAKWNAKVTNSINKEQADLLSMAAAVAIVTRLGQIEQDIERIGQVTADVSGGKAASYFMAPGELERALTELEAKARMKGFELPHLRMEEVYRMPTTTKRTATGYQLVIHMPLLRIGEKGMVLKRHISMPFHDGEGMREVVVDGFIAITRGQLVEEAVILTLRQAAACLQIHSGWICHEANVRTRKPTLTCLGALEAGDAAAVVARCPTMRVENTPKAMQVQGGHFLLHLPEREKAVKQCAAAALNNDELELEQGASSLLVEPGCTVTSPSLVIRNLENLQGATLEVETRPHNGTFMQGLKEAEWPSERLAAAPTTPLEAGVLTRTASVTRRWSGLVVACAALGLIVCLCGGIGLAIWKAKPAWQAWRQQASTDEDTATSNKP